MLELLEEVETTLPRACKHFSTRRTTLNNTIRGVTSAEVDPYDFTYSAVDNTMQLALLRGAYGSAVLSEEVCAVLKTMLEAGEELVVGCDVEQWYDEVDNVEITLELPEPPRLALLPALTRRIQVYRADVEAFRLNPEEYEQTLAQAAAARTQTAAAKQRAKDLAEAQKLLEKHGLRVGDA